MHRILFWYYNLCSGNSRKNLEVQWIADSEVISCCISVGQSFHTVNNTIQYNTDKMPPGRTYVSGWNSRVDRSEMAGRSTIRDTGVGSATSVTYRSRSDDNSYDAIKTQCLQNGTLWEDPDFPAVKESLFFKTPPSHWPNIQWKRPHVITFVELFKIMN